MFVREADVAYPLGPASARPYLDLAVLERRSASRPGGRRLGRLGVRRRGPGLRRPVRADRRHLHRPERRGDAQARRQDRLQAHRRGGRRAGRAVEPRRRRHARGRARRRPTQIGYPLMLKATAGGGGRGIRMVAGPADARGRLPAHPRRGRSAPSAAASSSSSGWSPGARHVEVQVIADGHGHRLGARRPRLLGAAPQPEGHRGVRLAAARRRARPTSSRRRPSGSPSRSATSARRPSSSSTTRARRRSPSSRSTPGCRSSTRSPR